MITKQKDGWYVISEKSRKNLGGPYKNREEAVKRLQQVEYFKRTKTASFQDELIKLSKTDVKDTLKDLGAGAVAGGVSSLVVAPIDTVADAMKPGSTYIGKPVKDVVTTIYKAHGLRGFYKGMGVKLLKIAPAQALAFAIYKSLRDDRRKKG